MRGFHVIAYMATLLCLLAGNSARGQSGTENFKVERWSGGLIESDFRMALSMSGPGVGSLGGAWSARSGFGPENLFTNPALLGPGSGGLSLTGRLPVSNASLGLGNGAILNDDRLRATTDRFLDDLEYTSSETPGYTRVLSARAGQPRQIGAMAGSFRLAPGIMAALGYYRPLSLSMGLRSSGMEAVLDAGRRSGAQTIDIDVLAQGSASASASAQLDIVAMGLGFHLGTDQSGSWHLGGSVSRYIMHGALDWSIRPDLMIMLSGSQQYFFNDPTDPSLTASETNALFWDARGHYRGGAWGGRVGLRYAVPGEWLALSASAKRVEDLVLSDPNAYAEGYLPLFVNLSGELDPGPFQEEILDVERLNLAKPNLTKRSSDSLGTNMTFRQPSSLTLGLDLGLGLHTLTVNYVRYRGELSLESVYGSRGGEVKQFRVGKAPEQGIRLGLDVQFPQRMRGAGWLLLPIRLAFLDLDGLLFQAMGEVSGYSNPHFGIGGGVIWGDAVVDGVERNIRNELEDILGRTMPSRLVMYRRYTLFEVVDVGVSVAGVPDLILRTSLGFRLPD